MLAVARNDHLKSLDGQNLRLEALRTLALVDPNAAQTVAENYLTKESGALQAEAVSVLGTQPAERKRPRNCLSPRSCRRNCCRR